MQYAVNLADLTFREVEMAVRLLLSPVCPNKLVVDAEKKRVDGAALVLECEEERAQAICEVLQTLVYPRKGLRGPRCYESKTGKSWRKVRN